MIQCISVLTGKTDRIDMHLFQYGGRCILGALIKKSNIFTGYGKMYDVPNIIRARGCGAVSDLGFSLEDDVERKAFISSIIPCPGMSFLELLGKEVPQTTSEIFQRLLALNPSERGSARSALQLPYFANINPHYEATMVEACGPTWREKLVEEALSIRQQKRSRLGGLRMDSTLVRKGKGVPHYREVEFSIMVDEVENNGANEVSNGR
jgi:hypothetical protein